MVGNILSFPSEEKGKVTIRKIEFLKNNTVSTIEDRFPSKIEIKAHRSNIVYTLLSQDYSRIVTASEKVL